MNLFPSHRFCRALSALVCAALFVLLPVVDAQRAIPPVEENKEFFLFVKRVMQNGEFTSGSCNATEEAQLKTCLDVCNAPGDLIRDNCCCSATSNPDSNITVALFGIAGACRYRQQLLNYTNSDGIEYRSSPLSSGMSRIDENCSPLESEDSSECTCTLRWVTKWTTVQSELPTPSPSPMATSPMRTPTPSAYPSITNIVTVSPSPSASENVMPSLSVPPESSPSPSVGAGGTEVTRGPGTTDGGDEGEEPTPTMDDDGSDDATQSVESEEGGDGGVCVDERYLVGRGFSRDDMVHKEGRISSVLCPTVKGLPCGTEFHAVRLDNGRQVSYRQLCEKVQCTRSRMRVNSVWTHQWAEVDHDDVTLTMYDVRYPQAAQRALHRVMRTVRRTGLI